MQNMIQSLIAASLFKSQHIKGFLHHTNDILITRRIATDRARIGFRNIEATRTIDNTFFDAHNRIGQTTGLVGRATQNEEGQTLRSLHAYTW